MLIPLGPVYTMDHEVRPFKMAFVNGPTSMVRLLKKLVLKALGPSVGVNRMWTKKNYHAPKSDCGLFYLFIFNTCPERAVLKKFKFAHSLVFYWASLVFTSC
jgi:hypothetical protein